MATIEILLSTGSIFHLPLDDIFRVCRESGFDGLELLLGPELDGVPLGTYSALSSRWGVHVACVHAPFAELPSFGRDYHRGIELSIELAKKLNAAMVNAHPSGLVGDGGEARRLARVSGEIALSIENMPRGVEAFNKPETTLISDPGTLNNFARENGIKVTYDVSHFATWDSDILTGYEIFRPNLINIHLSDYIPGFQHLLPGRGLLPLAELLAAAARDGAARFVTLEAQPDAFESRDFAHVLSALGEAREFVRRRLSSGR